MLFFTADSHFCDSTGRESYAGNIIAREERPFKTIKEMNNYIIKTWNTDAKKGDTLYHLGDFFNYNRYDTQSWRKALKLVRKFNADVILICGNDEERIILHEFEGNFEAFRCLLLQSGFKDVIEKELYLTMRGKKFYLNHYPINHKSDAFNLFGHIHNAQFVKPYGFNIGVDSLYFKLFSEDKIFYYIDRANEYFDDNIYK